MKFKRSKMRTTKMESQMTLAKEVWNVSKSRKKWRVAYKRPTVTAKPKNRNLNKELGQYL